MTSERRVSRICSGRRTAQTASRIIPWMRGLAAVRAPKMYRNSDVSRSFVPDSGLSSTERGLRHAVLREIREEAFERPLPEPRRGFLQPTVVPEGFVWPSTRRMWLIRLTPRLSRRRANSVCVILAELNAFRALLEMTSALLRSWSVMDYRDPTATPSVMLPSVNYGNFGQAPDVAYFPLRRCCVQVSSRSK